MKEPNRRKIEARQRNTVWRDTLRNGALVNAFLWKGGLAHPLSGRSSQAAPRPTSVGASAPHGQLNVRSKFTSRQLSSTQRASEASAPPRHSASVISC